MKVTIPAGKLAAALRQVSMLTRAATVKRFPILGAVRLTAPAGAAVTLTSNDLDAQVAVTVAATVAPAGEVAIDAAALSALIAGGPKDSSVTLTVEDGGVVVHCGSARFELPAVPAADLISLALAE
jgi:DNA polymerase III subunit beta